MANLRDYLKEKGMTQQQFAEMLGVTQGAISSLCSEAPRIGIETAVKIENLTGGCIPVESWPQFRVLQERITDGYRPTSVQDAAE